MTTADRENARDTSHDDDPDLEVGTRLRLHHLRAGMPAVAAGRDSSADQLSEILAPFVAWLATQPPDEARRREHRDAAERYLRWCLDDHGPVPGRRARYERHLQQQDPDHLAAARAGLAWWTQHRALLAVTLPVD